MDCGSGRLEAGPLRWLSCHSKFGVGLVHLGKPPRQRMSRFPRSISHCIRCIPLISCTGFVPRLDHLICMIIECTAVVKRFVDEDGEGLSVRLWRVDHGDMQLQ